MPGWFDEEDTEALRDALWAVALNFAKKTLERRANGPGPEVVRRLVLLAGLEEMTRQLPETAALMARACAVSGSGISAARRRDCADAPRRSPAVAGPAQIRKAAMLSAANRRR